jgi:hypothetical protein
VSEVRQMYGHGFVLRFDYECRFMRALPLALHDFRRLRARRLYGWRTFKVRRGSA